MKFLLFFPIVVKIIAAKDSIDGSKNMGGDDGVDLANLMSKWSSIPICDPFTRSIVPVGVNVVFHVLRIDEIDDNGLAISVTGTFSMTWHDDCPWKLAAKLMPKRAVLSDFLPISSEYPMWRPKIVLINSATGSVMAVDKNSDGYPTVAHPSNEVVADAGGTWVAECSMDHLHFPVDVQTCQFIFETWLPDDFTNITMADVKHRNSKELMSKVHGWTFVSATAVLTRGQCLHGSSRKSPGEEFSSCWPRAKFSIKIKRKWLPYIFKLVIPTVSLSLLQLSTFGILPSVPERPILANLFVICFMILESEFNKILPALFSLLSVYLYSSIALSAVIAFYHTILSGIAEKSYHHHSTRKFSQAGQLNEQINNLSNNLHTRKPSKGFSRRARRLSRARTYDFIALFIFAVSYITLNCAILITAYSFL